MCYLVGALEFLNIPVFFSICFSAINWRILVSNFFAKLILYALFIFLCSRQILNPMGASSDAKGEIGMSSKGKGFSNGNIDIMDIDDDDDEELDDTTSIHDLGEVNLKDFCKEASISFFNEYGLISHQINSYNDFVENGIQRVFDSFGEILVEPGYDPSKKGDADWRFASVRFGKVTLNRPCFWGGSDNDKEYNMLPRHARLQNMTYSARMKVNVTLEVNKFDN